MRKYMILFIPGHKLFVMDCQRSHEIKEFVSVVLEEK